MLKNHSWKICRRQYENKIILNTVIYITPIVFGGRALGEELGR
jgi:hypothetical protein